MNNEYRHIGNPSVHELIHSSIMMCDKCMVSWVGSADHYLCPECGQGRLPDHQSKLEFLAAELDMPVEHIREAIEQMRTKKMKEAIMEKVAAIRKKHLNPNEK
jgi:hypothetical protein